MPPAERPLSPDDPEIAPILEKVDMACACAAAPDEKKIGKCQDAFVDFLMHPDAGKLEDRLARILGDEGMRKLLLTLNTGTCPVPGFDPPRFTNDPLVKAARNYERSLRKIK